jgi:hypothetical protein
MIFTFDEIEGVHHVTYRMPEKRKVLIGWAHDRKLAFDFCIEMLEKEFAGRMVIDLKRGVFDEAADD